MAVERNGTDQPEGVSRGRIKMRKLPKQLKVLFQVRLLIDLIKYHAEWKASK
jgi:hypothetical protein